jgi:hypothetical protein
MVWIFGAFDLRMLRWVAQSTLIHRASGPFIEGCPEPSLGNCVVGNYGPFVSVRAALLFSSWQMAMAGIARNIELYNSACRLAWKHVSEVQKRETPNIAWRLHDFIRREIKNGASEPLLIASEALRSVEFNQETWD